MMIIHAAKPLFAWDCLEDSPSLLTIKELLATLPDAKLLDSLRIARGNQNVGAFVGQRFGNAEADAAIAAEHQCALAGKP